MSLDVKIKGRKELSLAEIACATSSRHHPGVPSLLGAAMRLRQRLSKVPYIPAWNFKASLLVILDIQGETNCPEETQLHAATHPAFNSN